MARCCVLYSLLFPALIVGAHLRLEGAQSPRSGAPLTVEEVVKLSQAGFSEDTIITRIKKNGKAFDLSTDELLELKKLGISENIIKFLLDPALPYSPAPPAPESRSDPRAPNTPNRKYPEDVYASRVPAEPGLYRFEDGASLKIEIKILLGTQEGAGMSKVLMKKGKTIGYLIGPASKTRIKEAEPIFYLRLPEGKGIEEVVLVALQRKADRREIDLGPPGPKQELKAEAMRQFDSLEVGPHLFRITTSKLAKGEYLFFQLGTAEPPKGSYGKGYDFGIE